MGKKNDDFEFSFLERLHKRIPKDVRVVSVLAHRYTEAGRLDSGLRMDRKLVRMVPEDPLAHYNLACSLALKGRLMDAVRSLQAAVSVGYKDYYWMRNDPDLSSLKNHAAFIQLLRDLEIG